jgi:hypothetical protein
MAGHVPGALCVPGGAQDRQLRFADRGFLEREGQRVSAGACVADGDTDLPVRGCWLAADDDHRAGRVGGGVPAD